MEGFQDTVLRNLKCDQVKMLLFVVQVIDSGNLDSGSISKYGDKWILDMPKMMMG